MALFPPCTPGGDAFQGAKKRSWGLGPRSLCKSLRDPYKAQTISSNQFLVNFFDATAYLSKSVHRIHLICEFLIAPLGFRLRIIHLLKADFMREWVLNPNRLLSLGIARVLWHIALGGKLFTENVSRPPCAPSNVWSDTWHLPAIGDFRGSLSKNPIRWDSSKNTINFFYDSSIVASRPEEKGNQRFWGVAACLSARSCHVDLDARRAMSNLSALTSLDYPGGKKLNLSLPLHCRKFQHSARWQGRWIHVLQTDSQHSKLISWSKTVFQVKWTWNVLNLETFIHTFAKSCSQNRWGTLILDWLHKSGSK